MVQQVLFHVAPGQFKQGDWLQHGRFGSTVRLFKPGGPKPDGPTLGVLMWEMALEATRQAISPKAVSRLDCLFACETVGLARTFRDRFRAGSAIYAVEPSPGSQLFRGSYSLLGGDTLGGPYVNFMPPVALQYWTEPPAGDVEVLVGGPVRVLSVVEPGTEQA